MFSGNLKVVSALWAYKKNMSSQIRNIYSFQFKPPKLESLRELSAQITGIHRGAFKKDYGNPHNLLTIEVGVGVIIALA